MIAAITPTSSPSMSDADRRWQHHWLRIQLDARHAVGRDDVADDQGRAEEGAGDEAPDSAGGMVQLGEDKWAASGTTGATKSV